MFICQYCNREGKTIQSNRAHEIHCNLNPNRKEKAPSYGMKGKKGSNQYTYGAVMSKETRKKLSNANMGRKHKVEAREKISKARSEYLEEVGGGGFTHIKYYSEKNIHGEEFKLRGTWELEIARQLNKSNILWVRKKYLKYFDEYEKTYTPDFYLPEKDQYIEVKGYFSERDEKKLTLVKKCNNINLILLHGKNIDEVKRECHIRVIMPIL